MRTHARTHACTPVALGSGNGRRVARWRLVCRVKFLAFLVLALVVVVVLVVVLVVLLLLVVVVLLLLMRGRRPLNAICTCQCTRVYSVCARLWETLVWWKQGGREAGREGQGGDVRERGGRGVAARTLSNPYTLSNGEAPAHVQRGRGRVVARASEGE